MINSRNIQKSEHSDFRYNGRVSVTSRSLNLVHRLAVVANCHLYDRKLHTLSNSHIMYVYNNGARWLVIHNWHHFKYRGVNTFCHIHNISVRYDNAYSCCSDSAMPHTVCSVSIRSLSLAHKTELSHKKQTSTHQKLQNKSIAIKTYSFVATEMLLSIIKSSLTGLLLTMALSTNTPLFPTIGTCKDICPLSRCEQSTCFTTPLTLSCMFVDNETN